MRTENLLSWCREYRERQIAMSEIKEVKRVTKIKFKCLLCNTEIDIKVPIQSRGNFFYVDTPRKHCGVCFSELDQVVDGREKQEENGG